MSLRVIPVIDLRGGLAVHARGGRRAGYRPVQSVLCAGARPEDVARACRDRLGLSELYVADLDAIGGGPVATDALAALAGLGLRLWVDAGVRDLRRLRAVLDAGAARAILATETVGGPDLLRGAVETVGAGPLVLGIDLSGGRPLLADGSAWTGRGPLDVAAEASDAGLRRFLILDLLRVGAGGGVSSLPLAGELARRHGGAEVAVGGGVASAADLDTAARAGVDAVLVASALHDGTITRATLDHLAGPAAGGDRSARSNRAD